MWGTTNNTPQFPNKEFKAIVSLLREKNFYEAKKPRKISWPEYNLNQINELKESLTFIKEEIDRCQSPTLPCKVGRPLTNPKSLAKGVLFCELFQ